MQLAQRLVVARHSLSRNWWRLVEASRPINPRRLRLVLRLISANEFVSKWICKAHNVGGWPAESEAILHTIVGESYVIAPLVGWPVTVQPNSERSYESVTAMADRRENWTACTRVNISKTSCSYTETGLRHAETAQVARPYNRTTGCDQCNTGNTTKINACFTYRCRGRFSRRCRAWWSCWRLCTWVWSDCQSGWC